MKIKRLLYHYFLFIITLEDKHYWEYLHYYYTKRFINGTNK